jgi:hypothetical protein
LDDPDLDAKYSDDFLIRHIIMPSMVNVNSRINNSMTNPVVSRLRISLVDDQQYYQLPPTVGEIWNVCEFNTELGTITKDYAPRGHYNPRGPNWKIEGNQLSILPLPEQAKDIDIFYTHNGDLLLHYGTSTTSNGALASDLVTFTLDSSPTIGAIDKRPNAYAGAVLRVLSGNVVEERIIDSSSSSKESSVIEVTVRTAFDYHTSGEDITYEIAPSGFQPMYEAIAASGALKLASYKKITGTHFQMIQLQYKDALKSAADHYANIQMRMPKHLDKDTIDNRDNTQFITH